MNNTMSAQNCLKNDGIQALFGAVGGLGFLLITTVFGVGLCCGGRGDSSRIKELEINKKLEERKRKLVRVWVELTDERGSRIVELQNSEVATNDVDRNAEVLKWALGSGN
jgi:hypothetical protein